MSVLVLEHVSLSFGPRRIVEDLSLRIADGDRIGLIGPNGSGKTTLLRLIAREQAPDGGEVRAARDARVGWLPQDIHIHGDGALLDFVKSSVPGRTDLETALSEAEAEYAELLEQRPDDEEAMLASAARLADLHEAIAHFETTYSEHEALRILSGLGFKEGDAQRDIGEFSGGWKMRAVLASLLFQKPDVLLLDEPTNHLDMPSVAWFSAFLKRYARPFILISHDREFLNEQINRVVSLEVEGVRQFSGDYEGYVKQRAEEEEILENKASNLEREREKAMQFITRFRAQASKAKAVQSRIKQLEKMESVETYRKRRVMSFRFPTAERAGHEVVRVKEVKKAYGDHVVLPGVTLSVYRGDRIGIIGPNGAGKTTLLRMIAGELDVSGGDIELGHAVKPGYYAQHHAELLHPKNSVYDEVFAINREVGQTRVRTVLGAVLFSGDDVDKKIGVLSGGERARVALARLLIDPGNLLLLDEPTNHLDLESCESLIATLDTFDGTMAFVSHNRALIRRLANKIWSVEDGTVTEYQGNLDDYMRQWRARYEGESESSEPKGNGKKSKKKAGAGAPQSGGQAPRGGRQAPRGGRQAPQSGGQAPRGGRQAPRGGRQAPQSEEKSSSRDKAANGDAKRGRERRLNDVKEKKRRDKRRAQLERQVGELEVRIADLERAQTERNDRLCQPGLPEAERSELLTALQVEADRLEAITQRWEQAQAELDEVG